jgi:hypothetical protein
MGPEQPQTCVEHERMLHEAVLRVGVRMGYHLCNRCAALPEFARRRTRERLKRARS